MRKKLSDLGKFIVAIVCFFGGLGSFLQWLGIRPKDLTTTQPISHILWLLLAIVLFSTGMWSSLQAGILQRRKIEQLEKALTQEQELARRCKDGLSESASRNLEYRSQLSVFSPLQREALSLSLKLLDFIESQGPPPAPKYSREQITSMSSEQTRRLIEARDKHFDFACEYYFGGNEQGIPPQTADQLQRKLMARYKLLDPWYEKTTASYNLEFRAEVEKMYNRFAAEGLADELLRVPVEGRLAREEVSAISSKLWELAYRLKEKEVVIEQPAV